VAREKVDDLVTGAVHRFGHLRDLSVQVASLPPQQPRVRDVLNECVVEEQPTAAISVERVEKPRGDEALQSAVELWRVRNRLEQVHLHPAPDYGGRLQDRCVSPGEQVDSRSQ
jgi:hypothetical protein